MVDIPVEDACLEDGHGEPWDDQIDDKRIFWTFSPIFLFEHAQGRCHNGGDDVAIAFIDRRAASKANAHEDCSSGPTKVHSATDLPNDFGVPDSDGWGYETYTNLASSMGMHGCLSHAFIEHRDPTSHHTSFIELKKAGLFTLCPQLEVEEAVFPDTLYFRCMRLRIQIYRTVPIPAPDILDAIQTAWNLAKLFMAPGERVSQLDSECKPPLYIFLMLLSLQMRPTVWPEFQDWIKEHYNAVDVNTLLKSNLSKFADSLDEVHEYLQLLHQAHSALNSIAATNLPLGPTIHNGEHRNNVCTRSESGMGSSAQLNGGVAGCIKIADAQREHVEEDTVKAMVERNETLIASRLHKQRRETKGRGPVDDRDDDDEQSQTIWKRSRNYILEMCHGKPASNEDDYGDIWETSSEGSIGNHEESEGHINERSAHDKRLLHA